MRDFSSMAKQVTAEQFSGYIFLSIFKALTFNFSIKLSSWQERELQIIYYKLIDLHLCFGTAQIRFLSKMQNGMQFGKERK